MSCIHLKRKCSQKWKTSKETRKQHGCIYWKFMNMRWIFSNYSVETLTALEIRKGKSSCDRLSFQGHVWNATLWCCKHVENWWESIGSVVNFLSELRNRMRGTYKHHPFNGIFQNMWNVPDGGEMWCCFELFGEGLKNIWNNTCLGRQKES